VIRVIRAICVALAVAGSSAAHAETIVELPKTKAQLVLEDEWTRIATQTKDVQVLYKHDNGSLLAVTRADVPNPDAWVKDKKQAYADDVERGIKATIPGYKRTSKKLVDANGVPALDVEAKRQGGATVIVRVLLFRTYALSLAIEVPTKKNVAAARTLAKSFAPPRSP
jgi:hypothetical protein